MKDIVFGSVVSLVILVAWVERTAPQPELPDYMWVCNKPTVSGSTYCTPQPATDYEVK